MNGRRASAAVPTTVNLSCERPPFDLQNTPSRACGLSLDTERGLRQWGCELIVHATVLLDGSQVAAACAQRLFNRFFYRKSFTSHNVKYVAEACLLLAGKVEEDPHSLRHVVNVCEHVAYRTRSAHAVAGAASAQNSALDGDGSREQNEQDNKQEPYVLTGEALALVRNEVIKAERRVLKELGFCVHLEHPHKLIIVSAQS